jgi:hypothetical protein
LGKLSYSRKLRDLPTQWRCAMSLDTKRAHKQLGRQMTKPAAATFFHEEPD